MDGNSALLVQDRLGVTAALVTQSAAQRASFQKWGDSLALDWKHCSNNVGYQSGYVEQHRRRKATIDCDISNIICFGSAYCRQPVGAQRDEARRLCA